MSTGTHEFWYLSRAAGFTAYLLLTTAVVLGLLVHTRLTDRLARRNATYDLHRFIALLALAFTLFHVYILLGDGYFEFTVRQLSLPFVAPYRPVALAVGVLATYGLIVVVASFYVRHLIGYRAWRALHYATFVLFVGAAAHGILSGTDSAQAWGRAIYLGSAALVCTLVAYRVQADVPDTRAGRLVRLVSAALVALVASFLAFTVVLA